MSYKDLFDRIVGQVDRRYMDDGEQKLSELYTFSEEVFIEDIMSTITEREQIVLYYRFGFNRYEHKTLKAIGQLIGGVTKERVRQIEGTALRKLKHPTRSMALRSNRRLKDVRKEREEKWRIKVEKEAAAKGAEIDRLGLNHPESIEWLELSVRSRNCLLQANITTIGELMSATGNDLLKLPNFGRKSLHEIHLALKEKGLAIEL